MSTGWTERVDRFAGQFAWSLADAPKVPTDLPSADQGACDAGARSGCRLTSEPGRQIGGDAMPYRSPVPTYELRHASTGRERYQVVEHYRDESERVVLRSRFRRDAVLEVERLREIEQRPPMAEAEVDALLNRSRTKGDW